MASLSWDTTALTARASTLTVTGPPQGIIPYIDVNHFEMRMRRIKYISEHIAKSKGQKPVKYH